MTKAPISLQDLRRSLYVKAKAEPSWRFWGLYVHVCKMETLREAYQMAESNHGAPGIDGVTFEAIEEGGVESFLVQIRDELVVNTYLRFVRGIIDSEDLPLNVSREILQQNRVLTSIRTASVKKILTELKNIAANQPDEYLKFITQYNRLLKEGLYSDFVNRESLLDLIRFKSTKVEGLTSLADVKSRMKDDQKSIYYITGGTESLLGSSPLLEIYRKKDLEVLILDDDIDEIIFSGVDKYGEIALKAVNKVATGEDLKDETEPDKAEALKPLLVKLKALLGDRVKDVRVSARLADSPSCIVSDEEEPSLQMQQMLRAMGQKEIPAPKPTLEINPDHEIVKKLLARPDDAVAEDAAWLLLDQALLMEGVPLHNPSEFVRRLNRILNLSV